MTCLPTPTPRPESALARAMQRNEAFFRAQRQAEAHPVALKLSCKSPTHEHDIVDCYMILSLKNVSQNVLAPLMAKMLTT